MFRSTDRWLLNCESPPPIPPKKTKKNTKLESFITSCVFWGTTQEQLLEFRNEVHLKIKMQVQFIKYPQGYPQSLQCK